MTRIAILDDWQGIAESSTDWRPLGARATLHFLRDKLPDRNALVAAIADCDAIMVMRERSAFPRAVIERLPKLRMIATPGLRNRSIDLAACTERGIIVCNTPVTGGGNPTAELALGLLLACARQIPLADAEIRAGRFQQRVAPGIELHGALLGLVGLGRIGARMAGYAQALGMRVQAWSPNLTAERCAAVGVQLAGKQALMATSDAISIHMVLSERSRGLIGAADLAAMKPGAILVNTSRGPLVEQAPLLAALNAGRIMAGLDVYPEEPIPADDPIRTAPNCVLTPHLGYVTQSGMADFYRLSAENLLAWLDGAPIRVMNPEALGKA